MGQIAKKMPARVESEVKSKAEVTRQAKLEGKKVHFVTLMDLRHLKNSGQEVPKNVKVELY